MNIQEQASLLTVVISALNNIELKGKNNLDNLSGSIRILEEMWVEIQRTTQTVTEQGER